MSAARNFESVGAVIEELEPRLFLQGVATSLDPTTVALLLTPAAIAQQVASPFESAVIFPATAASPAVNLTLLASVAPSVTVATQQVAVSALAAAASSLPGTLAAPTTTGTVAGIPLSIGVPFESQTSFQTAQVFEVVSVPTFVPQTIPYEATLTSLPTLTFTLASGAATATPYNTVTAVLPILATPVSSLINTAAEIATLPFISTSGLNPTAATTTFTSVGSATAGTAGAANPSVRTVSGVTGA